MNCGMPHVDRHLPKSQVPPLAQPEPVLGNTPAISPVTVGSVGQVEAPTARQSASDSADTYMGVFESNAYYHHSGQPVPDHRDYSQYANAHADPYRCDPNCHHVTLHVPAYLMSSDFDILDSLIECVYQLIFVIERT